MPNQTPAVKVRPFHCMMPSANPADGPDPLSALRREMKLVLVEQNMMRIELREAKEFILAYVERVEQLSKIEAEAREAERMAQQRPRLFTRGLALSFPPQEPFGRTGLTSLNRGWLILPQAWHVSSARRPSSWSKPPRVPQRRCSRSQRSLYPCGPRPGGVELNSKNQAFWTRPRPTSSCRAGDAALDVVLQGAIDQTLEFFNLIQPRERSSFALSFARISRHGCSL